MYPATDVPYWKKGSITMIVVVFVFIGFAFVVRWVSIVADEGKSLC
jgi:ACS family pantothenate transporter-like MFS transporter